METVHSTDNPQFWIDQWDKLNAAAGSFGGYASAATWNAMAPGYGRQSHDIDKLERLEHTLDTLVRSGVRLENARVLDVGCGPGRYAQAFVQRGAQVVCIDISDKMIERLRAELSGDELQRITPVVADWKNLDLAQQGFEHAFDLVFANMTPAVSTPRAFLKLMQAGRGWCWFRGWYGRRENPLLESLRRCVQGGAAPSFQGNFLCAFNLACASGYFPQCTFDSIAWSHQTPLEECVQFHTTFFKGDTGGAAHLEDTIRTFLAGQAVDGFVRNRVQGHTGAMLWNLNHRTGAAS